MNMITLSRKHELVIPRAICESAGLKEGASFEVISYDNRLELIPVKPMKQLKGMLKGINTDIIREDDRI